MSEAEKQTVSSDKFVVVEHTAGEGDRIPSAGVSAAETGTTEVATPEVAGLGSALKDLTVPTQQALEAWNEQVRLRMRRQTRRSFLGIGSGITNGFRGLAVADIAAPNRRSALAIAQSPGNE